MSEKKLTMVVPAYNEEEALPIFYAEALRVEKELPGVEIEYPVSYTHLTLPTT